ncbi:hypothetical protein AJ79_05016 [Helicocarpus griseus UAMH5409]|uniref:Major facilitator superfamily (MFS) profile domain-containing protein n=1 Tax=Helicocarpus griseus UAMH5409 TaxID=1447875 RepID=A0A2B7XHG4_9EURO|nr:hypothetical protein AJ79_05016 [Helicocarpus griseus UAMH5409]
MKSIPEKAPSPSHSEPPSPQKGELTSLEETISPASSPSSPSCFTKTQKHLTVFLITFAATFSPLSSFIFFPAVNALSTSLNVSIGKINLTITSYMIVAGIAPAVIGDMADMTGRRIVYLLTMSIYCMANVGLALQSSWAALFVLRMLQSAGSAATIAIGYGVVSDIAAPSERGGYVGAMLLGPNFATAIGPILGGALAQHPGWRWIFWLLAISSGLCFLLIVLFLPETFRFIVGNGSRKVSGLHRTLFSYPQQLISSRSQNVCASSEDTSNDEVARKPFRVPNPLASLRILWAKDTALIMLINGIYYTNFSCLQASMSTLFIKLYGLSELHAGLVYLPFGVGSCLGAYCSGKIMDHDYRRTARNHNIVIDTKSGDDLTGFPIEKARLKSIWYVLSATGACTIGYGWTLQTHTHIAVPLVLQFITGFSIAITFNLCCTLLVDMHPKSPAAATAANNIVRCALAGVGLAVLQPLLDAIDPGWTFTLFGALCGGCNAVAWLEWRYGQGWRARMREMGINR